MIWYLGKGYLMYRVSPSIYGIIKDYKWIRKQNGFLYGIKDEPSNMEPIDFCDDVDVEIFEIEGHDRIDIPEKVWVEVSNI